MSTQSVRHIALYVESLRQAERFYCRLFDLKAICCPKAIPAGEAGAACLLGRGDFRLVLIGDATEPAGNGRLAHICVDVSPADIANVGRRASALGCRILRQEVDRIELEDVYGIRWRVVASEDPGTDGSLTADS